MTCHSAPGSGNRALVARNSRQANRGELTRPPIGPLAALVLGSAGHALELADRGVVVEVTTATGDPLRVLGRPMTYLRAPVRVRAAAPRLKPAGGTNVSTGTDRVSVDTRP